MDEQLDAALRKAVSPHTVVRGLEKFPFQDYSEFLEADRNGRVEILTAYDAPALAVLGTSGEKALNNLLTWSPFLTMAVDVVLTVIFRSPSMLLGIPLAFLGMVLSIPGFMRTYGIWLDRFLTILLLYFLSGGWRVSAVLVGSYLLPNVLTHAARHHCRGVFVSRIRDSEIALLWLFRKGSVVLKLRP
jgi:hypothetical protein